MTKQEPIERAPHNGDEELTPRKKKAMLEYMTIMFAAAFLLVAVSLVVKVRAMQDDIDAANTGAHASIVEMEKQLDSLKADNDSLQAQLDSMQNSVKANELLALAQNALNTGDTVGFHGYMAELEGYAKLLSEPAAKIYTELLNELS